MHFKCAINRVLAFFIASLSIVVLAQSAHAQFDQYGRWENGVSEPWWFPEQVASPVEIADAQSRWKMIRDENSAAGASEWAGDYAIGSDTHGSFLRFSPHNGFVLMHVDKCAAQVMGFSYGRVAITQSLIQLLPELDKQDSAAHQHTHNPVAQHRFIPVTWHGVHYLVREDDIAAFGDHAAGLGTYNGGLAGGAEPADFFYKLTDAEKGSADDLPVTPPGYERFVKRPIDAKITAVGHSYVRRDRENEWYDDLITPVTINVGRTHGVKPKMTLHVMGFERSESVEVRRVGLRSSEGVIVRWVRKKPGVKLNEWDDGTDPDYTPITVGLRLTTSWYKNWLAMPAQSTR